MYQRYDWSYAHPMMNDGGLGWLGVLLPLLVLVAFIALAVYFIRVYSARSNSTGLQDPLDIARDRYAKGEITKEQFIEIKRELK